MAITLISRPTQQIADLSPGGIYLSRWNATGMFDKINYTFNIQTADLASKLVISIREFGSDLLLSTNTYRPFMVGSFIVDVAPFVRSYLYSSFDPDMDAVNSIDVGCSLRFYIEYTQVLEDGSGVPIRDNSQAIYAVNSAMDIGNGYASNMFPYVPINADITDKALFLTDFDTPVWFEGYPLILSWCFDSTLAGKEIYLTQSELNSSQVEIELNEYEVDASQINRVNYLVIQPVTNSNTKFIDISLRTQNDIPDVYVDAGYVDEGYTQVL